MRIVILALCALVSCVFAVSAADAPATSNDTQRCIIARTIRGWSQIDDRTIILRAGGHKYKVTFHHACREAKWSFGARPDHFGMCLRPGDALIFSSGSHPLGRRWDPWGRHYRHDPFGGFEERCTIKTIELMPPTP